MVGLSCLFVCHNALGGGDDSDTESAQNLRKFFASGIDTKTGFGNSLKSAYYLFALGAVLQRNDYFALNAVFNNVVRGYIAFVEKFLAIDFFMLDAGTSTVSCFTMSAFLMRVSISAIGSVISCTSLPTSLLNAGDLPFVS